MVGEHCQGARPGCRVGGCLEVEDWPSGIFGRQLVTTCLLGGNIPNFWLESWVSHFFPGEKTLGFSADSQQHFVNPGLIVFWEAFGGTLTLGSQHWELKGG